MLDKLRTLLDNTNQHNTCNLILDAESYANKILLQGKTTPWHDGTAYANYLNQTSALLKPQAIVVRLDNMMTEELAQNTQLVQAMGEKSRSGYALKVFMGDEAFKTAVGTLVTATIHVQRVPVLLQLPSPLQLLQLTTKTAQPDIDASFDDDDAENAAIYYADWLRILKDANIAGLIFDERDGEVGRQAYQPITNTANHYNWAIGVRRDNDITFIDPDVSIPVLTQDYWTENQADVDKKGTVFTEIPVDAKPEQVLEKISTEK